MSKTRVKSTAIIMALVLIGAIFVTLETVSACHSKSASCNPNEQDIIELPPDNHVTILGTVYSYSSTAWLDSNNYRFERCEYRSQRQPSRCRSRK